MAEQHGKTLVPQIRFAGFTDPWEQRKLGELTEIKDSARIPNRLWREAGVPYIRASDISQEDLRGALFIDEEDYAAYKAATGAPEKGDVLFNGGGEIGKAIINGNSSPIYVQGGAVLYARIAHSSLLDARYLVAAFVTQNVVNAIGVLSAGGTMKHFTLQPAKNLPIEVPSIAEQRRIGAFFDRLDSLITLHQRKYDKLCVLKKSMLDKMFPKGGSLYPEIRFAGFTDPWEQRKLGEVASGFEYGLNAAASDFDGEKKYLRITDIDDQTREFRTDDLSSPDINNPIDDRYLLKEGDILFARTGASVGKTYLYKASDGKTYYAGFLIRAHVSDEADAGFIFQSTLTERYKQFVLLTSQRSGQPGINAQEYSDLLLPLPSLMEQRRIGAFFDRLDSLITLHQRKLELLRNIKKSMLDKMFV
ncbi:restriction endonuclease subunit S [Bifidobacterium adolescentis]|uniref:restriction endonuclease subunit S n=1 Tax=Bifidobacterium adolescentis TaxID=1680 RepID=UPI00319E9AAA